VGNELIKQVKPFRDHRSRYVAMDYFTHNSPSDRAREEFKPLKMRKVFYFRLIRKLGSFGFEFFCGLRHDRGRFRYF